MCCFNFSWIFLGIQVRLIPPSLLSEIQILYDEEPANPVSPNFDVYIIWNRGSICQVAEGWHCVRWICCWWIVGRSVASLGSIVYCMFTVVIQGYVNFKLCSPANGETSIYDQSIREALQSPPSQMLEKRFRLSIKGSRVRIRKVFLNVEIFCFNMINLFPTFSKSVSKSVATPTELIKSFVSAIQIPP